MPAPLTRFQCSCAALRAGGGVRRGLAGLLLLALLAAAGAAWGQDKPAGEQEPALDPRPELEPLLRPEPEAWLAALDRLREQPGHARELLLAAIEQDMESPRRWRIYHHMIEFGRMEDIPLLLERLATVESERERTALRGAAEALYLPADAGADLSLAVEEFSFLQTRRPASLNGDKAGRLALSDDAFRRLHLEGAPVTVIRKLQPIRGRTYDSEAALGKALARALGKRAWEAHGEMLLAAVERIPERVALEGTLRVRLRNPLQRPLMVRIRYEAWFGRFDPPPRAALLYVEPGEAARHDLPVRIVRRRERESVRVDLRMWEVQGAFVPTFQKLYIGS